MEKSLRHLIYDFLLIVLLVVFVCIAWDDTFIASALSVLLVLVAMISYHKKEDIIFYFIGFFAGGIIEVLITAFSDVWIYSNPFILGIPLWLPILWGFAFLIARRIKNYFFKLDHIVTHYKHHDKINSKTGIIIYDIFCYISIVLVLKYFIHFNTIILLFLSILFIISITSYHEKEDIVFAIIGGILGPINEIICISAGAWHYYNPSFLGIPIWLPILYASFAIIVRRTSITVNNLLFYKKLRK